MNTTEMRQQVKQYIDKLSPESLQTAADFLEYLANKQGQQQRNLIVDNSSKSALELAGDVVGCLEGPKDLSTNKDYLKGLGQ